MTDATDPTEITGPRARVDASIVPEWLKDRELWMLWNTVEKMPMAPWETGHCYRAAWGADAEDRPETDYSTAKMVADMPTETIHESYPFPRADDGTPEIPETVAPTIFLPHDPPDPPLMLVDFDDVRNPETGEITDEVFEIVQDLNSYTEVSRSGTGLHVFVRAALPDGLGKFIAPLDGPGDIEMYDHGRFVGATWDHVDGTPTAISEAGHETAAYVEYYKTESHVERMSRASDATDGATGTTDGGSKTVAERLAEVRGSGGDTDSEPDTSPYIDIPVEAVADQGAFSRHRDGSPGPDDQGPHPAHGGTSSADADSTNFYVPDDGGPWYCHAHDTSGGALPLLATIELRSVGCRNSGDIWDDPLLLLKTCLIAREQGYVGEDADPPYGALVGAAKHADLTLADREDEILGSDTWRLARIVFDELEPGDIETGH